MERYRKQRMVMVWFITAYCFFAYAGGRLSPRGEFFPVFNWSLFTYVAKTRTLPEVYVFRIGDKILDKPTPYMDLGAYFSQAKDRSTNGKKILERYGASLDPVEQEELMQVLRKQLFEGQSVAYEVRAVRFRPLDRWRDGTILKSSVFYTYDDRP